LLVSNLAIVALAEMGCGRSSLVQSTAPARHKKISNRNHRIPLSRTPSMTFTPAPAAIAGGSSTSAPVRIYFSQFRLVNQASGSWNGRSFSNEAFFLNSLSTTKVIRNTTPASWQLHSLTIYSPCARIAPPRQHHYGDAMRTDRCCAMHAGCSSSCMAAHGPSA
jgi:hypothetical protein